MKTRAHYPADYHIHTSLCKHATGGVFEYVERALELGIPEMGFADHAPVPRAYDEKHRMSLVEYPLYLKMIDSAREGHPGIRILRGIEADWVPGRMDEVSCFLEREEFDYVLGSVHYTDDFGFDDPETIDCWDRDGMVQKVWSRYLELLLEMVRSGLFDIISHCDLPKKFGHRHPDRKQLLLKLEEIFTLASANAMAIEINTSGLRKPVGEFYPSQDILETACRCGVNLVFGSDSHRPGEVGANFRDAVARARSAGFTRCARFRRRETEIVPLPTPA